MNDTFYVAAKGLKDVPGCQAICRMLRPGLLENSSVSTALHVQLMLPIGSRTALAGRRSMIAKAEHSRFCIHAQSMTVTTCPCKCVGTVTATAALHLYAGACCCRKAAITANSEMAREWVQLRLWTQPANRCTGCCLLILLLHSRTTSASGSHRFQYCCLSNDSHDVAIASSA